MEQRRITVTVHRPETRAERERRRNLRIADRACALAAGTVVLIFLGFILAAIIHTRMALSEQTPAMAAEPVSHVSVPANGRQVTNERDEPAISITFEEETAPEPEPEQVTEPVSRYAAITENERELIARMVFLEAGAESAEGQQAAAEVILNRVAAENFPSTVEEVLYQGYDLGRPQFSPIARLESATAGEAQYEAVDAALFGESILPLDVVYFSRAAENSRVWGAIGNHVFCRQYIWD